MLALERVRFARPGFDLDVSLAVAQGARLVVLGASGAGKSTLLDLIAGFEAPSAGRVVMGSRDVTGLGVAARPASILFQDGNLFPHLSVAENVALGAGAGRMAPRTEVEARLAQVGLAGFGPRRPGGLSGGQVARVALARMLLMARPLALMDEPFAALDPALRREMADLVADLCDAQGLTAVIVAHDLRGLERLATDVCLMQDGRIVWQGPVARLRADPPAIVAPWL